MVIARGFSLIELVIVVVIIGIIGAIAVPRFSSGTQKADHARLRADLTNLQKAIELYAVEHNGQFPSGTEIADQLTRFTDIRGNVSRTRTGVFIYGPYMRTIPALSIGKFEGKTQISVAEGPEVGWFYSPVSGTIRPNTIGLDIRVRKELVNAGILDR